MTVELERVAEVMCDKYCKWPDIYDEEAEGMTLADKICVDCPMNKLLEENYV